MLRMDCPSEKHRRQERKHKCLDQRDEKLEEGEGISVEVIDPRTLLPLDRETIVQSIQKTGKAVIVHEAPVTGGFGAEVAAVIAEQAIEYLDGPILRVGAPWCSVPANRNLEKDFYLPSADKIIEAVKKLVQFGGDL